MKWLTLLALITIATTVSAQQKSFKKLVGDSEISFITTKAPKNIQSSSLKRLDEKFIRWRDDPKYISEYYNELISRGYLLCDYKIGQIKYFENNKYSKSDTLYFVNKPKGVIVQIVRNEGTALIENSLYITSNWYSQKVRKYRKSEPEYEFENYFQMKKLNTFNIDDLNNQVDIAVVSTSLKVDVSDEQINLKKFEELIIGNKIPISDKVAYKYNDKLWRLVSWRESNSKIYKFNQEKLDLLGYEFVKTSIDDYAHKTNVYRNCTKGLVLEITEWFSEKIVSISLNWYDKSIRPRIGYLVYCDLK